MKVKVKTKGKELKKGTYKTSKPEKKKYKIKEWQRLT